MKLIIHGGFFSESSQEEKIKTAKKEALKSIIIDSFDYLKNHTALETVVFANVLLEDNPLFNAGIGSQIQSDGKIRMSASIMDGKSLRFSGVINIEEVKNPIKIAEVLLNEEDRVLGGEKATDFARINGFEKFDTSTEERINSYRQKLNESQRKGTVGCVALDKFGDIAAATSTGGKGFEIPGRVSDSATTAGNYANKNVGISCAGVGEDIVSLSVASKIATRVDDGMSLEEAFSKTFSELKQIDGFAGAIAIDKTGKIYHKDSFPTMVFASYDGNNLEIFS